MTQLPFRFNNRYRGRTRGANSPEKMNGLEKKYADYLDGLQLAGQIAGWWFHPFGLRLAPKTFLHPDFLVMKLDGSLYVHDTKGGPVEDDAAVKMKCAAEKFPFRFQYVRWKNSQWEITDAINYGETA